MTQWVRLFSSGAPIPGNIAPFLEKGHFKVRKGKETLVVATEESYNNAEPNYFSAFKLANRDDYYNSQQYEPIIRNTSGIESTAGTINEEFRDCLLCFARENFESQNIPHGVMALLYESRATPLEQLPKLLAGKVGKRFFELFPEGSIWFLPVNDLLRVRLVLIGVLFGLTFLEIADNQTITWDQFKSLKELHFGLPGYFDLFYEPCLLSFYPKVYGVICPRLSGPLAFLFGRPLDYRDFLSISLSDLYHRATPFAEARRLGEDLWQDIPEFSAKEFETYLDWWTRSLNLLFGYLADPGHFVNLEGNHDASQQFLVINTIVRVFLETVLIQNNVGKNEFVRKISFFSLLDKLETLFEKGLKKSGEGFCQLLKRSIVEPRIGQKLSCLPPPFGEWFNARVSYLFDYNINYLIKGIFIEGCNQGERIWVPNYGEGQSELLEIDRFISEFLRAVRNSEHGYHGSRKRNPEISLLAVHDGNLPNLLSDLGPIYLIGMLTDPEAFLTTPWLTEGFKGFVNKTV